MTDIKQTLNERGKRYGSFKGHAEVSQRLKVVVQEELETREKFLPPVQQEAVDMILHKLARIVNGDASYIDSWRDIVGYTQLVVDELLVTDGSTDVKTLPLEVIDGQLVVKGSKLLPEATVAQEEYVINFGDRGDRDGYKRT
jgi:nucleoid-associated protein YejK